MARGEVDLLNRVFKVQLFMRVRGSNIQTQWHLRDAGAPTSTAEDVLNDSHNFLTTELHPAIPTQCQIMKLSVVRLIENSYAQREYVGTAGSNTNAMASTMLASVIQLKSAYRERSANGRMFWPAPGAPNTDNHDGPILTAISLAAQKMQDRYCGPPLTSLRKLVVVSYPKKKGNPPQFPVPMPPTKWADVDLVRVSPLVTAIRSRKAGVGG